MLAVILWLCLGLALPIVMSLYSRDVTSDAVEAAPADAITLHQPIMLSASPNIWLERGTVAFVDGNGLVLPLTGLSGPSPAPTSQNVRIYNGTLAFGATDAARKPPDARPATAFPTSPFAEVLLAGRYETLSLRRTTLLLGGFFEEPEPLTDVKADVSFKRRGFVSVKGTALLRGQRVAFDATANLGQAERSGAVLQRVPLKLSLKGDHIDFNFDGRMALSQQQVELHGQGDLSLPSGRGLARWFGSYWPSGAGLRDLSVKGQLRLSKQALSFENAVARMDGNEATGVLGLRLRQPRPVITGTLAYKTFDARPYMARSTTETANSFGWSSLATGILTVPLGLNLDADLRLSADRVQFGTVEFGHTATTIALKDGRLLADFADIKFNGGEGGGQITADFTGFVPRISVRGKLDQVDLASLSATLAGSQLLSGRGGIVADLAGTGATLQDLTRGLAGKILVRGQSPGRLNIDLRGLATAASETETAGWGAAMRGTTGYDNLDLKLVLKDGIVLTESAETKGSEGGWTAVGVVNLQADRLDLRINQSGTGVHGPKATPRHVLELQGLIRDPKIKSSPAP